MNISSHYHCSRSHCPRAEALQETKSMLAMRDVHKAPSNARNASERLIHQFVLLHANGYAATISIST